MDCCILWYFSDDLFGLVRNLDALCTNVRSVLDVAVVLWANSGPLLHVRTDLIAAVKQT
jgi:hypothetical protein